MKYLVVAVQEVMSEDQGFEVAKVMWVEQQRLVPELEKLVSRKEAKALSGVEGSTMKQSKESMKAMRSEMDEVLTKTPKA